MIYAIIGPATGLLSILLIIVASLLEGYFSPVLGGIGIVILFTSFVVCFPILGYFDYKYITKINEEISVLKKQKENKTIEFSEATNAFENVCAKDEIITDDERRKILNITNSIHHFRPPRL